MQRRRVAVVARGPVAGRDLVAEVLAAEAAAEPHDLLRGRLDLDLGAVHRDRDDGLHRLRLRDVRLVVAAQVLDLPLVEEHDAGDRRQPALGQDAGRLPRLHVVVEGEERGELDLRPRRELERRLGRDPERALVAGEELLEVERRARGLAQLAAAALADLDDLAGRQDDLHRDHVVARVAEAGAEQRPAAGADPAADQRARVRRRVVGIEDAVRACSSSLSLSMLMPGPTVTVRSTRSISWIWFISLQSIRMPPRSGTAPSLRPGAAGARDDRDLQAVGELDDLARPPARSSGGSRRRGCGRPSGGPGTARARGVRNARELTGRAGRGCRRR